jgi:hypothetical protein
LAPDFLLKPKVFSLHTLYILYIAVLYIAANAAVVRLAPGHCLRLEVYLANSCAELPPAFVFFGQESLRHCNGTFKTH